jgi:LVIVD repeat-containing protein
MGHFRKAVLMAAFASAAITHAELASKSIVVLQPQDLPQSAQVTGQSMALHVLGNGLTYLYIEQQQAGQLAILDVTDPAHIQPVGVVKLDATGAFDFGETVNDSAILVSFRDGTGAALLDLRKPKAPVLSPAAAYLEGTRAEKLGQFGLVMANDTKGSGVRVAQDYSIVDASNPGAPQLLGTVKHVKTEIANESMGTTYLLGEDGLTVVRRPAVELTERQQSSYSN